MRRLEQVTALVVAAGLAVISYWLFFSWAGGGGVRERTAPKPAFSPTGQSMESKGSMQSELTEIKAPPSP